MKVKNRNFHIGLEQNAKINEINDILKDTCKAQNFNLISNENIGADLLWEDGIHLSNEGREVLEQNLINSINSNYYAKLNTN